MPAAVEYAPDNKEIREAARQELQARQAEQAKAWEYYEGKHRQQLETQKDEPDDNVVINLCKEAVDRTVSFLIPGMPRLELEEATDTDAERWLRAAWAANRGYRLLQRAAKNGAITGHVFMRVAPREPYPRLVVLDPANIIAFWKTDDYETILWYEICWSLRKTEYRHDIVNLSGSWLERKFERGANSGGMWRLEDETEWPWPLGPIVDWAHEEVPNRFYGRSELTNLRANDQANKVASDVSRILRHHAAPKTIGTGVDQQQDKPDEPNIVETAIQNLWTVPNEAAKFYNLEMQSDLASSINFLQILKDAFLAERRVVVLKGDVADFQRVTNLGMRALFVDALSKNNELREQYEWGIAAVSQRMRMLAGDEDYETTPVQVHSQDPLPVDPTEATNVIEKQMTLRLVSQETSARDLGRDWKLEQERMARENGQVPTPQPGRNNGAPAGNGTGAT